MKKINNEEDEKVLVVDEEGAITLPQDALDYLGVQIGDPVQLTDAGSESVTRKQPSISSHKNWSSG